MRAPLFAATLALGLSATEPAWADSYTFGGRSGRVELDVYQLGFHEGAGGDGWEEDSARAFAAFAKRVERLLPEGATVSLDRGIDDEMTTLTLYERTRRTLFLVPEVPGYDEALDRVARHFGKKTPPATSATLYTLQLLATRSGARAIAYARALDDAAVLASDSFYYQACLPCSVPSAHVLGPDAAGLYRVVTGIFDDAASAHRSLRDLRRRHARTAFVRAL